MHVSLLPFAPFTNHSAKTGKAKLFLQHMGTLLSLLEFTREWTSWAQKQGFFFPFPGCPCSRWFCNGRRDADGRMALLQKVCVAICQAGISVQAQTKCDCSPRISSPYPLVLSSIHVKLSGQQLGMLLVLEPVSRWACLNSSGLILILLAQGENQA